MLLWKLRLETSRSAYILAGQIEKLFCNWVHNVYVQNVQHILYINFT